MAFHSLLVKLLMIVVDVEVITMLVAVVVVALVGVLDVEVLLPSILTKSYRSELILHTQLVDNIKEERFLGEVFLCKVIMSSLFDKIYTYVIFETIG